MDPSEFQKVAAELASGSGPAHWRSATSRAYYAVFNVAAAALRPVIPLGKGAKVHGQIQRVLGNCGDHTVQEVASDLGDPQSRRIDADYDMDDRAAEHQATVKTTVMEALAMIRAIDQAFEGTGTASAGMKKSIQTYWTTVLSEPLGKYKPIV